MPPRDSPKILYGCLSNEGRCTLSSENRRYGVYQGKKGKGSADMPMCLKHIHWLVQNSIN